MKKTRHRRGGEGDEGAERRANREPEAATCPFPDTGHSFEFNQTCKAFGGQRTTSPLFLRSSGGPSSRLSKQRARRMEDQRRPTDDNNDQENADVSCVLCLQRGERQQEEHEEEEEGEEEAEEDQGVEREVYREKITGEKEESEGERHREKSMWSEEIGSTPAEREREKERDRWEPKTRRDPLCRVTSLIYLAWAAAVATAA